MTTDIRRSRAGLAYRLVGDGATIDTVVVHGMAEEGAEVLALAEALAAGHRVLVPDLPGHGASGGALTDLTIDRLAVSLAGLCDELGVGSAVVVAHSLGGAVSTSVAAQRPDLVSRLVLLDPGMAFPAEARSGFDALYDSLTAENFADTLMEVLPPILFGPGDDTELTDRVMAGMVRIGVDRFVALGRGLVAFEAEPAMASIEIPVLFMANDTPLASVATLQAHLTSLTVTTVSDVSHQGLLHDDRVVAAVREFCGDR